jgi:6-pyruvoyl-tetrahydropterin synthase
MSTISVQTHFAAGHRILGLPGEGAKCRNIHGHTFTCIWTIQQDAISEEPVEFGELKQRLKEIIKAEYDHGFLLDKTDDFVRYLSANMLRHRTLDGPPTTERIAEDIAKVTMQHFTEELSMNGWKHTPLAPHARLLSVRLEEGPENTATWENPEFVRVFSTGGRVEKPGLTLPNLCGGMGTTSSVGAVGSAQ